jgi:hypothetical protein
LSACDVIPDLPALSQLVAALQMDETESMVETAERDELAPTFIRTIE